MKRIIPLILTLTISSGISADSNWRMHVSFDEFVNHVVDSPEFVYFTSRTFPAAANIEPYYTLFRYDKAGDELISLSTDNLLAYNIVQELQYNPEKKYLTVVYSNYDIDLLHDDGSVTNIPYYRLDNPGFSRKVNSISSDPKNDRVYLATDFGYVALNDRKGEIAESRLYHIPLKSVCRIGDFFYAIRDNQIIGAPVSSPRFSLSEYETLGEFDNPLALYPLGDGKAVLILGNVPGQSIKVITLDGYGMTSKDIASGKIVNVENTPQGILVTTDLAIHQISKDGEPVTMPRPENFRNSAVGSYDLKEFWLGESRKGLQSVKPANDNSWTITKNFMLPDAPAPFLSPKFAVHPDYGVLALNYGSLRHFVSYPDNDPFLLSGLKNGRWKNYSPLYTDPERGDVMINPNGVAVDPVDPSYAIVSSPKNGFVRMNLNNPDDFIHISYPNDPLAGKDDFVGFIPNELVYYGWCNFSPPTFDSKGNLWMCFPDWRNQTPPKLTFFCWTAEDRKATTSADNIRLPLQLDITANLGVSNYSFLLPLLKTGNGLILYVKNMTNDQIAIIDTNGTPAVDSDDTVYRFQDYVDRDGNVLTINYVTFAWEDPSTGYVWMGHNDGVFYIDPKQTVNGNYMVNRVKVSRNDGTNLADYLLDGVAVYGLTSDSAGRKWFATGGGLICTSSDGREIISEFNTDNSPMPSDEVIGVVYSPQSNSILLSTTMGMAEYFLPGAKSEEKSDIKVYPNPVRPDFTGYVTITDIPEGSIVKIADSAGNLVKELGRMEGFELKWDISDVNYRRVGSGVYYILVSPGDESGSFSKVGKILVIS
ncbi:MAG: hypothetical protein J1E95_04005 [Muribaculaceae bacterium]|nr:hypothetical protein [Muribaculaceae bacterium]